MAEATTIRSMDGEAFWPSRPGRAPETIPRTGATYGNKEVNQRTAPRTTDRTGRGPDTRKPPPMEWPKCSIWMVGARGFEPPAPCSRSQFRSAPAGAVRTRLLRPPSGVPGRASRGSVYARSHGQQQSIDTIKKMRYASRGC